MENRSQVDPVQGGRTYRGPEPVASRPCARGGRREKENHMKGYIHSIESFGSADGPGIRFIIFLKGCALRCKYCHNVDTWVMKNNEFPSKVRLATGEVAEISVDHAFKDDIREVEEILDMAERYRNYWGETGGITVSGGEPLLQADFLLELLTEAKKRGMNTCIDTAGQPFISEGAAFEKIQEIIEKTDLVLLDIKHIDPEEHKRLTGHSNENILEFAKYLDSIHKPVWIRHVLVPGITDVDEYLEETADFLSTLSNVERIDVLPYHSMGVYKWKELGLPYALEGVEAPSKERVENAKRILSRALNK